MTQKEDLKMFRCSTCIAILSLLLAGCATVDYVGQSYEPTTQVEIFYDQADIEREYTVMGRAIAKGDDLVSSDKIQNALMNKGTRERCGCDCHRVIRPGLLRRGNPAQRGWHDH
jgi:hypothetical protein